MSDGISLASYGTKGPLSEAVMPCSNFGCYIPSQPTGPRHHLASAMNDSLLKLHPSCLRLKTENVTVLSSHKHRHSHQPRNCWD